MTSPYHWLLPVQASDYAATIDRGLYIIHAAMALIFVLWSVFFVYLLVRYRQRDGHKADRTHMPLSFSLAPDVAVLLFEILLIVVYAIPSWSRMKMDAPDPAQTTNVQVVAEQFNWNIRYPGPDGKFGRTDEKFVDFTNPLGIDPSDPAGKDDVVSRNELHFPVGKRVLVRLTAKDVIHDFFIPSFRIKQDAVPGLATPLWFTPTRVGHYELTCAQLCGVGHAAMRADVIVEDKASFDAWLASRRNAAPNPAATVQW